MAMMRRTALVWISVLAIVAVATPLGAADPSATSDPSHDRCVNVVDMAAADTIQLYPYLGPDAVGILLSENLDTGHTWGLLVVPDLCNVPFLPTIMAIIFGQPVGIAPPSLPALP